jgi:hypothetical protein
MIKFLKKKIPIWKALVVIVIWTLMLLSFTYGEYLEVEKEKNMKLPEVKAPERQDCDALTPCPEGEKCYLFEGEENPICWPGDPCQRCESKECDVAESYPMQVFCK